MTIIGNSLLQHRGFSQKQILPIRVNESPKNRNYFLAGNLAPIS